MRFLIRFGLCLLVLGALISGVEASGEIETGVPLALARERAARLSDLKYDLRIVAEPGREVHGLVEIKFELGGEGPLSIDFAGHEVTGVGSGGIDVPYIFENEHIVIEEKYLRKGRNRIVVTFVSDERPLHREERYFYSLFVPARARYVFPCFDQPDLKAIYTLRLTIPVSWTAIANTPSEKFFSFEKGKLRHFRIFPTKRLSTYHFSFAAGEFSVETAKRDGRVMNLYHMEPDSAKVARNLSAIFDLHAEALRWMEEYTGMPYPFRKFDFLALPAFPYSGMEHPGAILYRAERLFLDESATEHERLRRASVISHETAHMWFGDLVTMEWFDDVWLKEAFAQFMADRIIRPAFPEVDHQLLFISSHHDPLHDIERSAGTHPIRQELDNLNEAGSVYGDIIYHKPPVMLNQIEKLMGEEQLREALREYLRDYSFGNATWEELVKILDRHSDHDLVSWSNAWVMEAGRPTVSMQRVRKIVEGREHRENDDSYADSKVGEELEGFVIEQSDPMGRGLVWTQEFSVARCSPDLVTEIDLRLDSSIVKVKTELPENVFLLPDSHGEGFGFFELDASEQRPLFVSGPRGLDPVQRAMYARILRENFLSGAATDRNVYFNILNLIIDHEQIELNIQAFMRYTIETFWLFLPRGLVNPDPPKGTAVLLDDLPEMWEQAYARGPERMLLNKILTIKSVSAKSACFDGFRSIAMTDEGIETLKDVWEGKRAFDGLKFSERDYCAMALELAVREVKGWEKILDRQAERIEDPELKKRFAFVRRAVEADQEKRDLFFASLAERETRRREPWVLEALYYLHHPLRTESSVRYIPASLELLEEIRDTGDIFFPRDWIKTILRYHRSEEAVGAVDSFLAARPDYPVKLRRIILQAVDIPRRAAQMD